MIWVRIILIICVLSLPLQVPNQASELSPNAEQKK